MSDQANRRRREENFRIGEKVFLSLYNYKVSRLSRKLAEQNEGPFEVIKKKGNSYRLALPLAMKIYPVFSPDKLRRAYNDPLPGQANETPDPVQINGENEWEVDEILALRLWHSKLQY
jgi:hypothetical protein